MKPGTWHINNAEMTTLKTIAELINANPSDFQDERGYYDRFYITERFGLTAKQYHELMEGVEI